MRKHILVAVTLAALSSPAGAETNAQQQRMKDCNVQATGMTGGARKEFMSTCLGGLWQSGQVQSYVRPFDAVPMTAGPDGVR